MRLGAQRGFAYIALLVLVLILGTLSAISLSVGSLAERRAAEEELLFIGAQFSRALSAYRDATPNGQRPYPETLDDLLNDRRHPGVRRYLRRIYIDPLTGRTEWGTVSSPQGGIYGVYSLASGSPLRTQGFAPEFARLRGARQYSEWVFIAPQINK